MTTPIQIIQDVQVEAPVRSLVSSTQFVGKIPVGVTTPSVRNVDKWITQNTGAVTITDFLDGQEGQTIKILGDGHSSVQNGTNIITASGATALLAGKVYTFTLFNGVWHEDTHS